MKLLAMTVLLMSGSLALANDVVLPLQRVNACVRKATKIVSSPIQLEEIAINGRTSRQTTFTVKTELARYTGDVDTADVVATCFRPGREVISVMMEQKNPERTRYQVRVLVNCRVCE